MIFPLNWLQGRLTLMLLSRPSARPVNEASLGALTAFLATSALVLIVFSFVQWRIFEGLHKSALEREARLAITAGLTQEMSTLLCNAHRASLSSLLATDDKELSTAARDRERFLQQYAALEEKYQAIAELPSTGPDTPLSLAKAKEFYAQVSGEMVKMIMEGNRAGALAFRLSTVRPAFDAWQEKQETLVESHLKASHQEQAEFARQADATLKVYLYTLLLPLGVVVALIFFTVIILGAGLRKPSNKDPWVRS